MGPMLHAHQLLHSHIVHIGLILVAVFAVVMYTLFRFAIR